jgi:hypothetical protein
MNLALWVVDMAEFIIGLIAGLNVGVGITGYIYNKKIVKIRDELLEIKIDLMHK